MSKFVIANDTTINKENLQDWLKDFKENILPNLQKLDDLYEGKDEIKKVKKAKKKIDNKVHVNLAYMIANNSVNYFIGKPVSYKFDKSYSTQKKYIEELQKLNKEQVENKILAKDCSKYGIAYELINVKEDKSLYFKRLKPLNTFIVVDNTILEEKVCAITYTNVKSKSKPAYQKGFVYTKDSIFEFTCTNGVVTLSNAIPNVFRTIPVVVFQNNHEMKGDYQPVEELLSGYSKHFSCGFDDFESVANALLIIYNATLNKADRDALNESGVLGIQSEDGQKDVKAEYINKKLDNSSFSVLRDGSREEIFAITNVADFTDKNFAGNQAAVALSYKLLGFENLRTDKVTFFAQGLMERWEIIGKYPTKNSDFDSDFISLEFYANIPENIAQDLEYVTLWEKGAISKRTMLSKMESVPDVEAELKELDDEEKENIKKTKEIIQNDEIPEPKHKLRA